ncbi:MAG: nucleotidyltransferase domain-containing protein [Leptospiraceae bacterium]|nr:nucleotidyltransferase domain-containing protein [Leptospiraceae bacterium]MCP5496388.1 nucleotidyltransferase domain-containing protein [Leptospiraceae bacterium]
MDKPELKARCKKLEEYCKTHNVIRAILFGSQARGTANKKSDFDIIIIYNTEKGFFERYNDFKEVYPFFDNNLDLLLYTPTEWEVVKNRKFFIRAIKEGNIVYG